MIPKGTLLIIGGAEDKGKTIKLEKARKDREIEQLEILRLLLCGEKKVEVITTASNYHLEVKKEYERAFNIVGIKNAGFMHIEGKKEAGLSKYIKRIEKADAIFFSGGDQLRLTGFLGGTPLIDVISKRYMEDENLIVAGTSAGAMVMSKIMISRGGTSEVVFRDDLELSTGFGLLELCIIDSHFIKRGRFGRLAHAVILNPEQLGIGLGEDTALIIKNGEDAECVGSGVVVMMDGTNLGQTNIHEEEEEKHDDECGVFVENLTVHLMVKGCRFNLKTKKIAKPAKNPRKEKE